MSIPPWLAPPVKQEKAFVSSVSYFKEFCNLLIEQEMKKESELDSVPKCIKPEIETITLDDCLACSGCVVDTERTLSISELQGVNLDVIVSEECLDDFLMKICETEKNFSSKFSPKEFISSQFINKNNKKKQIMSQNMNFTEKNSKEVKSEFNTQNDKIQLENTEKIELCNDLPETFASYENSSLNENIHAFLSILERFLNVNRLMVTKSAINLNFRSIMSEINCKRPSILSECPGVVTYLEKKRPDLLIYLSKTLSLQQIGIEMFKNKEPIENCLIGNPKDNLEIKTLSIMQCADKSLERDVEIDFSISSRDLFKIFKTVSIDEDLQDKVSVDKLEKFGNSGEILSKNGDFNEIYERTHNVTHKIQNSYSFTDHFLKSRTIWFTITINEMFTVFVTKSPICLVAHVTGLKNLLNFIRNKKMKRTDFILHLENYSESEDDKNEIEKSLRNEPFNIFNYILIDIFLCRGRCANGPGLNSHDNKKAGNFEIAKTDSQDLQFHSSQIPILKKRTFKDQKKVVNTFKVEW